MLIHLLSYVRMQNPSQEQREMKVNRHPLLKHVAIPVVTGILGGGERISNHTVDGRNPAPPGM